jgi:hypothetical protein
MTTMPKRDRLIEAAKTLFYQQGVIGKTEPVTRDLAIDLISSLQGTYVLTASFRSPELLERKLQRLEMWIRTL